MREKEVLLEETNVEARVSYTRPIQLKSPQMYGEDVKAVQRRLNELKYNAGTVDGYYGPTGVAAVKDFQKVNGLTVDGSVGPATWNKLFSSTAKPKPSSSTPSYTRPIQLKSPQMYGEDVKAVQRRLNELKYNAGTVDGYYGPTGVAAVKDFQKVNGLTVDGSVGPATWNKLFSSTAKPKPSSGERYEVSPISTLGIDKFTFSVKTGGSYPNGRKYRMYSAGATSNVEPKIWYKDNWKEGSTYQIYYRINASNTALDNLMSSMMSAGWSDLAKELAEMLTMWVISKATVGYIVDDINAWLKGIEMAHKVLGNITVVGYMAEYATHLSNLNYHWKKI